MKMTRASLLFAFLGILGIDMANAQQPAKMPIIGYLSDASGPAVPASPIIGAFLEGLKELGYVEGKNVAIEYRFAERKSERVPALATELVALKVDVIVAESGSAALQAKKITQTVPIVMGGSGDPVGMGLVASLARPGGNVTGMTDAAPGLVAQRLQLLAEIVPRLTRVGALWSGPGNPVMDREWAETTAAAQSLNVQLHAITVRSAADLPDAFAEAARQQVQAVIFFPWPTLLATAGPQIAELAVKHRMATMSHLPRFPQVGGMMSYGADPMAFFRRAANYVDRILKGANPAEMPVEGPSKFLLVINLKTARALDLPIPQSILGQADRVIE